MKAKTETKVSRPGSLQRMVRRRIDLRKPKNRRAIEALIALALRQAEYEEPTDAEIVKFLREWDEGKHKLNADDQAAIDAAHKRFKEELREHMSKTGNDIYGRVTPPNAPHELPETKTL